MYCVQVSARIIHWPGACACCCQPADTSIAASSTRTTGKKVVHTHTKSWDVPYCRRCLAHIRAAKELRSYSRIVIHRSVVIGLCGAVFAGLVFWLVAQKLLSLALILGLLAGVGAGVLLVATFAQCQEKYRRDVQSREAERSRLER